MAAQTTLGTPPPHPLPTFPNHSESLTLKGKGLPGGILYPTHIALAAVKSSQFVFVTRCP